MATKKEKIFGYTSGAIILGYFTYKKYFIQETTLIQQLWYTISGMLIGGVLGLKLAKSFGSTNNTVNYTLYNKEKRVYEGITYVHRFHKCIQEHKASGKSFTHIIKIPLNQELKL